MHTKLLSLIIVTSVLIFMTFQLFGQKREDVVNIKTILENPKSYNDTFAMFTGKVSNFQLMIVNKGYMFLSRFTVTDQTDSIKVLAFSTTLKDKDSVLIIGKFLMKRKVGQYIVGENEVDASLGEVDIIKAWSPEINTSTSDEFNFVPVNQIETPSTKLVTYLAVLGVLLTALSLIPVFIRLRRFNIDLKIVLLADPTIKISDTNAEKFICVDFILYNLKLLPPDINQNIVYKKGKTRLSPIKILKDDASKVAFPIRVEQNVRLVFYFNYESTVQFFSNQEPFIIILKDEFCMKKFSQKFDFTFTIPEPENENDNANQS